eukprot:s5778_g4.t1
MIRKMTDCAFQWAQLNNRLRTNAIHQDEEALLILNETYQLVDESGEEINMSGEFELEVDSFVQPLENTMTNEVLPCRLLLGNDDDDDLVEELFVSFAEGESGPWSRDH